MNTSPSTFSVVLFNHNYEQYLPESLDAALNQSVAPDEIIIIDDASTDGSVALIESWIKDRPEVKFIQNHPNKGIIATQNFAVEVATSDFVFFIASDDRYSKDTIKWCRECVAENPEIAMISGNATTHNDAGLLQSFTLPFPQTRATYSPLDLEKFAAQRCMTFFGGANIMRRDVMLELGGYLPELKWHCDWLLYLLIAHSQPFAIIPENIVSIRRAEGQYSEACHDPKLQAPVSKTLLTQLRKRYKPHYPFFKQSAMLPIYDIHALVQLLTDKDMRGYLTPLLAWRLISYGVLRKAGRLIPTDLRRALRRLLRV